MSVGSDLRRALDVLHDIGMAMGARRLGTMTMTAPLREGVEKRAMTDQQIEDLALDTWEKIVTARHYEVTADGKTTMDGG